MQYLITYFNTSGKTIGFELVHCKCMTDAYEKAIIRRNDRNGINVDVLINVEEYGFGTLFYV